MIELKFQVTKDEARRVADVLEWNAGNNVRTQYNPYWEDANIKRSSNMLKVVAQDFLIGVGERIQLDSPIPKRIGEEEYEVTVHLFESEDALDLLAMFAKLTKCYKQSADEARGEWKDAFRWCEAFSASLLFERLAKAVQT